MISALLNFGWFFISFHGWTSFFVGDSMGILHRHFEPLWTYMPPSTPPSWHPFSYRNWASDGWHEIWPTSSISAFQNIHLSLVRPTTEFQQFNNFHSYFSNKSNEWPWYPSWKCLMNDLFDIFLGMFCWFFLLSISFPLPPSKIFWLSCVWISHECWNGLTITNQTKIKILGSILPVKFPQFGALASTNLFLARLVLKH